MPAVITYPLDLTGLANTNLIEKEIDTLTSANADAQRFIIPNFAPFYLNNLKLEIIALDGTANTLLEGVDFNVCLPFLGATRSTGQMVYGGLSMLNRSLAGTIKITYQTIGGEWASDKNYVMQRLSETIYNPRITVWEAVTDKPGVFPPSPHTAQARDLLGYKDLIDEVSKLGLTIASSPSSTTPIVSHLADIYNPHRVSKAQVGLSDVSNLPLANANDIDNLLAVDKYVTLKQVIEILINYQRKS